MIALDVMGGDHAPLKILKGALLVAREGIPLLLCGPQDLLRAQLDALDDQWHTYAICIRHAPCQIEMAEHPARSVIAKRDSSLVQAVLAVQQKEAFGVVSAGNSGALMVAALMHLGCQVGVERPAIAGFLPSTTGRVLCLDLGANADCKPRYLLGFAQLGVEYLKHAYGVENPRVGLLSNGSEKGKGSLLAQEAYTLLESSSLNFLGNVEPSVIIEGALDVVVTDGFSGNVMLKSFEAAVQLCARLKPQDHLFVTDMFEGQGGALLLGVQGTVVVAHGCAKEREIAQAIRLAHAAAYSQNSMLKGEVHGIFKNIES